MRAHTHTCDVRAKSILESVRDVRACGSFLGVRCATIFFNTEKFFIYQKCAGARCDPFKLKVRTRVRADLNLDVRGACVRRKKRSQLTPCLAKDGSGGQFVVLNSRIESSNNWRMPYLFYYQIMNPKKVRPKVSVLSLQRIGGCLIYFIIK